MKKVVHDSNQPFIYPCNKCNSICSIQIFNSYQTKICIDCNDMDEEIISIQDYLERIKNLSKEGNKCEKHEINALDICLTAKNGCAISVKMNIYEIKNTNSIYSHIQ